MLRLLDAIARAMAKADQRSIEQQATLVAPTREPAVPSKTFHVEAPPTSPTAEKPGSGPPEA